MLLILSLLTGHFQQILLFTFLIFVHELGHFLTAFCLGWKVVAIHIYPYGGCSEFQQELNVCLWQEWLVLLMGPLAQLLVVFLLSFTMSPSEYSIYLHYSNWLLIFNLLPIYPLDGGKLLLLMNQHFFSFYSSYRFIFAFSYFLVFTALLSCFFFSFNLILFLSLFLLMIKLCQEIERFPVYYQKFLFERYLTKFPFRKNKQISSLRQMKRDTYHYFLQNGTIISEFEYLNRLFGN